jgi:hypothetical protein
MADTINQDRTPNRLAAVLSQLRKLKPGDLIIPLIIPMAIFIIITVAWSIRIDALVKLEVVTDNVMLDLDGKWEVQLKTPLRLQSLYVDNIDINATKAANILPIGVEPEIDEANVYLQALKIINNGKAAKVELAANAYTLNMYVKEAHIAGKYNRPRSGKGGLEVDDDNIPPETIHFKTRLSSSSENRIELCTDAVWLLCNLRIHKIAVIKETFKGSGVFESTAKSGQLKVLNSGKTLQMGWGDTLSLEEIKETQRITIKKDPDGFRVSFLGKTGSIKAGPQGYEDDFRPRYLEYIYNNQPFALFMAAFGILWAVYNFINASI